MNKKRIIVLLSIILIVVAIVVLAKIVTTKEITVINNDTEVNLKYSTFNFNYTQSSNKEGILDSKNEEIKIKINDNLKESYESYNILRDYRIMAYNGQEAEYNNTSCFYYYDNTENQYILIAQINEESYLSIYIKPKENSNKNAEETFNQKKIQKILNTLEIKS